MRCFLFRRPVAITVGVVVAGAAFWKTFVRPGRDENDDDVNENESAGTTTHPEPHAEPTSKQTEAADEFDDAVAFISAAQVPLDTNQKLRLYACFKQATKGDNSANKPSLIDVTARAKWDAWKELKGVPIDVARATYIEHVNRISPNWRTINTNNSIVDEPVSQQGNINKDNRENKTDGRTGGMGPVSSTLFKTEEFVGERTLVDYVKEGNLEAVMGTQDLAQYVNMKDTDEMTPLHWACDRGHGHVAKALIEAAATVDSRDGEGQTPLHLACICGHVETVKLLVSSGAAIDAKDDDGYTPMTVADSKLIIDALTRKDVHEDE